MSLGLLRRAAGHYYREGRECVKYVGIVYMLSHCGSCLRQRKVDGDQSSVEIQKGYFMDEEVKCTWSFPPYGLSLFLDYIS